MRYPSYRLLCQTVTLYNKQPDGRIINGGYKDRYAVTVLSGVKYTQQNGASVSENKGAGTGDKSVNDSLYVMICPQRLRGCSKSYVTPDIYNSALDADRADMWTLDPDGDYIALGEQHTDMPSAGGGENRNDYRITGVRVVYNPDGSIHHFGVTAK